MRQRAKRERRLSMRERAKRERELSMREKVLEPPATQLQLGHGPNVEGGRDFAPRYG